MWNIREMETTRPALYHMIIHALQTVLHCEIYALVMAARGNDNKQRTNSYFLDIYLQHKFKKKTPAFLKASVHRGGSVEVLNW